jgi:hypothetical protein
MAVISIAISVLVLFLFLDILLKEKQAGTELIQRENKSR